MDQREAWPKFREVRNANIISVLVAEDQPANGLLLLTILRKAGFEVYEAANGRLAVEQWETIRLDVTFMDINMPELNGDEATKLILKKYAEESPVTEVLEETRTLMWEAGCQDFFTKPFTFDAVLELLVRIMPGLCESDPALSA